jgi:hypothetical protein
MFGCLLDGGYSFVSPVRTKPRSTGKMLIGMTDESPILPVQPLTARITSLVAPTAEHATTDALDAITCRVYPRSAGDEPANVDFGVEFSREDELVKLAAPGGLVAGLEGWEVESYECV